MTHPGAARKHEWRNTMNNILIATDGTKAADEALDVAIDMALETHAALNVLSVRRPRPAGRAGAGPAILEVEMRDGPKHIAEAAVRRARLRGHRRLHCRCRKSPRRRPRRRRFPGTRLDVRRDARERVPCPRSPIARAVDDRASSRRARVSHSTAAGPCSAQLRFVVMHLPTQQPEATR
jgi:hypothetical protein